MTNFFIINLPSKFGTMVSLYFMFAHRGIVMGSHFPWVIGTPPCRFPVRDEALGKSLVSEASCSWLRVRSPEVSTSTCPHIRTRVTVSNFMVIGKFFLRNTVYFIFCLYSDLHFYNCDNFQYCLFFLLIWTINWFSNSILGWVSLMIFTILTFYMSCFHVYGIG